MDLWKELERTCERTTQELAQINDRLEQNKAIISPTDLDNLFKIMDIIKDIKSTMKKIIEMDEMENQNGYEKSYSGNMYYTQPMWDRKYSGNSYHGTYTVATGDGHDNYSGRGMRHMYSRDSERENMRSELDDMLRDARDEREAETIRKIMMRL